MRLHLAIFEDDSELTELLQEMLGEHQYLLTPYLSLKQAEWEKIDLVLADYRNKIVPFADVVKESRKYGVPVVAISGGTMDYPIQLQKPFTMEELEALIYRILGQNARPKAVTKKTTKTTSASEQKSFWNRWFSGKKAS